MSIAIDYKRLDPITVYAVHGVSDGPGPERVAPIVNRLMPALIGALQEAGVSHSEQAVLWYPRVEGRPELEVWVSLPAGAEHRSGDGWEVVDLPAVDRAATWRYVGGMPGIGDAWVAMLDAVAAAGHEFAGPPREVYLETGEDQAWWVTELQVPIR